MVLEKLFFKLLYAKNEKELDVLISNNNLLNNPENWKPYGNDFTNYSLFENQQSNATGALIEKVMNSIDATLTRQCLLKEVPLSGEGSPQNMKEALDLFSKNERDNPTINVFAEGTLDNLNIVVSDEGEGQAPENFDNTLLSLQRGNKNNIKFVQGKFNMGSTGAVVFCGNEKYQLIVSRRHPGISSNDDSSYVGFTLVRKHPRTKEEFKNTKNTWYECFKINDETPKFKFDKPFNIVEDVEAQQFSKGTIVKMYNYDLPKQPKKGLTRASDDSTNSLYSQLNRLLFEPAFPIRILETRPEKAVVNRPSKNISSIAFGNKYRLKNMKKDAKPIYQSLKNEIFDSKFGTAYIDIYVFEKAKHITSIRSNAAILYLMNGQVQYSEGRSFISQDLGFKLIKDSMIIAIDCNNLSQEFHDNGFFMANRETLRDSDQTRFFKSKIIGFLKNLPDLDRLNRERAAQRAGSTQTQDFLNSILGKSIQNTALADLFKGDQIGLPDASGPSNKNRRKEKNEISLNPIPSYMKVGAKKINNDDSSRQVKSLPINKPLNLSVEIDATNDFFTRDINKGEMTIQIKNKKKEDKIGGGTKPGDGNELGDKFTVTKTPLRNGSFQISLTPNEEKISVGENVFVEIEVTSNQSSFTHLIEVEISKRQEVKQTRTHQPKLSPPNLRIVYRDQEEIDNLPGIVSEEERNSAETWEDVGWNYEEGYKKIVKLTPGVDDQPLSTISINMSSTALKDLMSEEGTNGEKREWVKQQYIAQLYLDSFMTTIALQKLRTKPNSDKSTSLLPRDIEEVELAEKLIEESAYMTVKLQLNNLKNLQSDED